MYKIYRDDDPNVYTCFTEFKRINECFKRHQKTHTVAATMEGLWNNHALFYYLATDPAVDMQLHGWQHIDYSKMSYEDCYNDLKKSVDYWNENAQRMTGFAKKITTFFAPWNRESAEIRKACEDLGLLFCNTKEGEWQGKHIRSFHWWSFDESILL